jgi:hypothetical protein
MRRSPDQRGANDDDMDRDALHQFAEASLPLEGFHEAWRLQYSQDARRDAARQVDAAGRKYLQCEIGRLTRKDRNKCVDCGRAQFALIVWVCGGSEDYCRGIFRRSDQLSDFGRLRDMFNVAKIFINVGNSNSGTYMFDAYVVEAPEHVPEQADLSLIRRGKIRMAAFRAVSDIM